MADDHRYDWLDDWLDEDAVERLLNGSPAAGRSGAGTGTSDGPVAADRPARAAGGSVDNPAGPGADRAEGSGATESGTTGTGAAGGAARKRGTGSAGAGASPAGAAAAGTEAVRGGDVVPGAAVSGDGSVTGPVPEGGDAARGAVCEDGSVTGSAPGGDSVPAEAERLVAVLRELVPAPAEDGVPLPGEEAALAAFREAKAAAAVATASAAAEPSVRIGAPAAPEPSVRLGAPAAPRRRHFSHRLFPRRQPLKAALAMALAGCAIGGVAVAAGAGVLPAPFGRAGGAPAAAPSVSAFGDEPAGETSPDGRRPSGASPSRGRDGGPSGSGTPDGSASSPGAGRSRGPGDRNEAPGSPSASPRPGKDKDGDKGDSGSGNGIKPGTAWAVRMCRDYLDAQQHRGNTVDEDDVRTLERAAGIGSAVDLRAFCERLVKADDGARSGTTGSPAGGLTGGRTGTGRTGDDDGNDGSSGVFRLVPPVRSSTGSGVPAPGVTFSGPTAL
ncbi:hypothetical protein ACSNOH_16360 [Streptomyces sp. URMC 127]|uniref:hypothetical protein n=1 Tax=Streptomyces sp. URMC 127 TaxID=3423402 RepID=UPI003F194BAC